MVALKQMLCGSNASGFVAIKALVLINGVVPGLSSTRKLLLAGLRQCGKVRRFLLNIR